MSTSFPLGPAHRALHAFTTIDRDAMPKTAKTLNVSENSTRQPTPDQSDQSGDRAFDDSLSQSTLEMINGLGHDKVDEIEQESEIVFSETFF